MHLKFIHSILGLLCFALFVVSATTMAEALPVHIFITPLASALLLAPAASNLFLGFYINMRYRTRRQIQMLASLLIMGSALTAIGTLFFPTYILSDFTLNEITQILLTLGISSHLIINLQSLNPFRRPVVNVGVGRETGIVKWFNVTKGFGFISRDTGDDVFVHYRAIRGEGHRALREGQRVDFSVIENDKGLQAEDVTQQADNF